LYLLFSQSQSRDKGGVKILLYHGSLDQSSTLDCILATLLRK